MPIPCRPLAAFTRIIGIIVVAGFSAQMAAAPQIDSAAVIQGIDRSVIHRDDNVLGYTVTERYTVFRNGDEAHPAAEMSVETTYTQNAGKSYQILSEERAGVAAQGSAGKRAGEREVAERAGEPHAGTDHVGQLRA